MNDNDYVYNSSKRRHTNDQPVKNRLPSLNHSSFKLLHQPSSDIQFLPNAYESQFRIPSRAANANGSNSFRKTFQCVRSVSITPHLMIKERVDNGIASQDFIDAREENEDNQQFLLKHLLRQGKQNMSMSQLEGSIFENREASPDSQGLMAVRREQQGRGYLKRSVLGQSEDFEELQKKKELNRSIHRQESPNLMRRLSTVMVKGNLKLKVSKTQQGEHRGGGQFNQQASIRKTNFNRIVNIPDDQYSQFLSLDADTNRIPILDKIAKLKMRHSESIKFWDDTVHKIRNRINQSQSLIERQSQYTSKSWVNPESVVANEQHTEPSIGQKIKDYFSSFRDLNYYYVSTTNNPHNQLFCINKTNGMSFKQNKNDHSSSLERLNTKGIPDLRGLNTDSSQQTYGLLTGLDGMAPMNSHRPSLRRDINNIKIR
ncbi:hypothetical protein FGO68_gene12892 [Halteria grandinella]|uniref:Uncharacterized protein n=1 Tax=Halteria grandinella TaxID=5974 RepID=A0A8J8NIF1_HALGN|nr:hypothetical protein FGO68_gene12892 [Halteria grandinella]